MNIKITFQHSKRENGATTQRATLWKRSCMLINSFVGVLHRKRSNSAISCGIVVQNSILMQIKGLTARVYEEHADGGILNRTLRKIVET